MDAPDIPQTVPSAGRYRRAWLSVLVVTWGAQAIVTQSLLLREALVLMFGSEFAWGVVLFAWLLGVAAGAALGGWLTERLSHPQVALVTVLLTLSVVACAELWVFRGARAWLGVGPGELLPLHKTALAAMLFVSPASALVGMAFPLACCVGNRVRGRGHSGSTVDSDGDGPHNRPCLSFGHVYALESAGSLIGGAAFSFWAVEHLTSIQTALICGALTAAASAGLLAIPPRKPYAVSGLVIVALAAMAITIFAGEALNRRLVERRWHTVAPGYELIAEAESRYQNLAIGRRAGQFTLYCDGQVSTDFPDPYTFVPLAHFWLCQHPLPRKVLVIGGGVEGLLSEILRHPIEHLDYVEVDPRQLELVRPFLDQSDLQALTDARVTVHHVDARHYIKTQHDRFDLVVARLPEPTSALRARLYTDEFYGELRRAMTTRSVLCLTAAAAPGELSAASREYLASIRATLRRHFPHLLIGWGDPAQVLAATQTGLISTDPVELAARYTQRGVQSELFHPAWFDGATDWLAAAKLARRSADLDQAKGIQISTDLRPSIYLQRLVLWEAATTASLASADRDGQLIERLRSVGLAELVAVLTIVAGLTLTLCRLRRRCPAGWASGAIIVSVATTGFATMALSIVWLFAFQNLYGYVYQRIGWIIALFMGGLMIGCLLGARRYARDPIAEAIGHPGRLPEADPSRKGPRAAWAPRTALPAAPLWGRLIVVDLLLAILALAVPFVLPALAKLPSSPSVFVLVEWCVSFMVVATGMLGGAAFALAGRLQLASTGRAGIAAGSVVGADHAGACLGALLCGILLVPVFGTAVAAFLLGGTKLCSVILLLAGRRFASTTA